jgi:hypothetical protein
MMNNDVNDLTLLLFSTPITLPMDFMTALNTSTQRRLKQLPCVPSVWEGDRRRLNRGAQSSIDWADPSANASSDGDCILWVDGSQGIVRAMDVVPPETGPEAVVRTLLKAMEYPHNPASPARPQKIVVRDREILFFLRGVLQNMDITLDYVPELPLIDEIFHGFEEAIGSRPPQLPPAYLESLPQKAMDVWAAGPWRVLADHQILAIELNQWDLTTIYASVMGMLGMEYGILFYRSLDTLYRFRQRVLNNESIEQMEEAFLGQDCLFVTFESRDEEAELEDIDLATLPPEAIEPVFGNLHPLEGMRSFLYEEESAAMLVVLDALQRFMKQHGKKFVDEAFPATSSRYKIPNPEATDQQPALAIKVSTMPDLAAELLAMSGDDDIPTLPPIRDDLVPENSFLSLGVVPWDMLDHLRTQAHHCQPQDVKAAGDGLPVVMIQTSRPKAKTLIEAIQAAGGLTAVCFNPGEDPFAGDRYDLGLFQTGNGDLHLFGEFGEVDPTHVAARKKWDQRCKKTQGCCGLIIAKGLTGATRGNPQLKDMVGLFEAQAMSPQDLGLGTLQLTMAVDWMS